MEKQEKKKKIEGLETDEIQKTFLQKLKSFFCFCTGKNNNCPRLKKLNCCTKTSKNDTQNQIKSKTADKRDNLPNEPQKTFLEKVNAFFRSIMCKNSTDERDNLTDEPQKTFLKKMTSFVGCCRAKKKPKNENKKEDKSLRTYIKQNLKWVILLLVFYIIIFGAVVSVPILVNHYRDMNQNETDQERSII